MSILGIIKNCKALIRDRKGVAAVEFAVSAPMLMLGMVVMVDLGLAVQERMNMDQALRAGGEFAMQGVADESAIESYVIASATGNYASNPGDVQSSDAPTVTVSPKTCECPDNPGTSVNCTGTLCSNNLPPSVFYRMSAAKTYDGLILPSIAMNTEFTVQVR